MNMFIGKGEELLNKGSAKLKDMKKKIKWQLLIGNIILVNHRNER